MITMYHVGANGPVNSRSINPSLASPCEIWGLSRSKRSAPFHGYSCASTVQNTMILVVELLNLRAIDVLILEDVRADKNTEEDANENVDVVVHCCDMLVRCSHQEEYMRTEKYDKVCSGELRSV